MPASANRRKISTTVAPETHHYLEGLVSTGKAANLAEAVDISVARARRMESRMRLERDTAAYFNKLSGKALEEEQQLATALDQMADEVDIDD